MPKVVENFFWVLWEACPGHWCSFPNHESLYFCWPVGLSLGDSARQSFLHLESDSLLVLMLQRSLQTKNYHNPPIHSQNGRVYGWIMGFFVYFLSCSYIYHVKCNSIWVCRWLTGLSQMIHPNHESFQFWLHVGPRYRVQTRVVFSLQKSESMLVLILM